MHMQKRPIYYVKYRNEEGEDNALRELISNEEVVYVTAIEEGRVSMRRKVTIEHCSENEEIHETTRRKKTQRWLLCTFKERRINFMKRIHFE